MWSSYIPRPWNTPLATKKNAYVPPSPGRKMRCKVFQEAPMWKLFAVCAASLPMIGGASVRQDANPAAEYKIPPEAIKQVNPTKPTPAGMAQAKKTYGYDCAMCHGADGGGKGELVESMKLKIPDFRDPASFKDVTDGELFYIIKNGKGDMPAEKDRAKDDAIWNLVNYIRSFAKKETPAKS
jgi:mono/diheme cytochrome c family protein